VLKNRIIPCLDVKNGRVVKGINFVNLVDAGDPVEQAKIYDEQGADELCFLDITASNENRNIILDTVKKTAEKCFIPLTVGGGVRTLEDIRNLLLAGADKVSINTAAVNNKNLVKESSEKFGSQCIVVAVDAKKVQENKWEIFTHGGRKSTGIDALKFVEKMESLGAGEILLTSMDRDGTKKGYDLDLTKKVSNLVNIPVIASGGVGSLEHLHQGIKIGKANAVLAASIFHFGEFSIQDAKKYLDSMGIPVRIRKMFKTLEELITIIRQRKGSSVEESYTNKLLNDKKLSIEKVKEEIAELIDAIEKNTNKVHEAADVLYHLMVLLEANGIKIDDVMDELKKWQKK